MRCGYLGTFLLYLGRFPHFPIVARTDHHLLHPSYGRILRAEEDAKAGERACLHGMGEDFRRIGQFEKEGTSRGTWAGIQDWCKSKDRSGTRHWDLAYCGFSGIMGISEMVWISSAVGRHGEIFYRYSFYYYS